MALYLGDYKIKVNIGGITYDFNMFSTITNGAKLLSSDSYILKDCNGLYLTSNEGEQE
jgi:hypothetical protein